MAAGLRSGSPTASVACRSSGAVGDVTGARYAHSLLVVAKGVPARWLALVGYARPEWAWCGLRERRLGDRARALAAALPQLPGVVRAVGAPGRGAGTVTATIPPRPRRR